MHGVAGTSSIAVVIGSMDLVRPLGLAGPAPAVVPRPDGKMRYSRYTEAVIDWVDPWRRPDELVERLVRFAEEQPQPPVLYFMGDWDLLLVSRHRERLGTALRFAIADAEVVEKLVDKARFLLL